jgi:hypothetical protein
MIRAELMPVVRDRLKVTIDMTLLISALAVGVFAFAIYWQWIGAKDERAFLLAEKYEALQKCEREQAVAYIHVKSGAVICAKGSMRLMK